MAPKRQPLNLGTPPADRYLPGIIYPGLAQRHQALFGLGALLR
jgi:hypothetical protein